MNSLPVPVSPVGVERVLDVHRPRYHFLPPGNWMNDPNGLIQWRGEYHIFYQYNPTAAVHGGIHWGHAASRDLVHWTHLPVALAPTPGTADEDGCWSGCIVDDAGTPTMIYTGFRQGVQRPCLAVSRDNLRTWEKWPGNPIIPAPPPGLDVLGFRDHAVWREADGWYQVIGSGVAGAGGAALLYRSSDLRHWEYLHPLCQRPSTDREPVWTGSMWECPDFFPLGDKHILSISMMDEGRPYYSAYMIGSYAGHRFTPERGGRLDLGDFYYYAPQSLRDDQGRRLVWGWVTEGRGIAAQVAAGWSGLMSLPRELTLRPDGRLGIAPVPEIGRLRGAHTRVAVETFAGTPPLLPDLHGDSVEIFAEIEPGDAVQAGLRVRCTPDGEEETRIYYDAPAGRLVFDGTRSSQDPAVEHKVLGGPLDLRPGEPVRLRVFLDRSVVEIFANEQVCLTARVYPGRADSQGIGLFTTGGQAQRAALDLWQMDAISYPVDEAAES